MGKLIPQIWDDTLVASHLIKANALHRFLQHEDLEDWTREFAQGQLNNKLAMLQGLGKRPVLRDGVYQLEE